jgi:NTP pyrophosphatase (non-canonical NTP hydrolase)
MGSLLRPARIGWRRRGRRPKGELRSSKHEATLMNQNPLPPNHPAAPAPTSTNAACSPADPLVDVARLQAAIALFARERDWDPFHSPKNLAMALTGEVGELVELFQWLSEGASRRVAQDPATARRVRDELADVLVYLVRLAAVLDVDLDEAVRSKLAANALKYPADRARGNAKKYSDL